MFHWICPECGQEIAPGVKECPVCEPEARASFLGSSGHSITAAPVAAAPAAVVDPAPLAERLAPAFKLYAEPPAPIAPQPAIVQQQVVQQPVVQQAVEQFSVQPVQKPKVVLQPEVLLRPEAILQAKAFQETKPPNAS